MTGLLLLLTMVAVTWLGVWSSNEGGQGGRGGAWSPFDMRGQEEPPPQSSPARERARVAAARERPWKRSGS